MTFTVHNKDSAIITNALPDFNTADEIETMNGFIVGCLWTYGDTPTLNRTNRFLKRGLGPLGEMLRDMNLGNSTPPNDEFELTYF